MNADVRAEWYGLEVRTGSATASSSNFLGSESGVLNWAYGTVKIGSSQVESITTLSPAITKLINCYDSNFNLIPNI
jgi:hypothetical protein